MGWYKACRLEIETRDQPVDEPALHSRGGLEGVRVSIGNVDVLIPREEILKLVGAELKRYEINRLEQMDDLTVVDYLLRGRNLTPRE